MHNIHKLVVGFMQSNCYILIGGDEGIVIDPGGDVELIIDKLNQLNIKCLYIINTHGHIDHIAANSELKDKTGAKILIHKEDANMLTDSFLNLSAMLGGQIPILSSADRLLEDGDFVEIPNIKLKVIHTPGHTPGGICLLGKGFVFTGDTLFEYGIGRTDFPGGSYKTLIDSINKHLLVLEDKTIIYPGHGDVSTIGKERKNNPFLK
jgi:glyoxylase-like metal-dependent hydrolase (beta-lactamase superfamily II)